jgi:hypothetical protein
MAHTTQDALDAAIRDLLDHTLERRILSLGYYDGTTNGLLRTGAHAFQYDLVSWDQEQNRRVYCLAPITLGAFGQAVEALLELGEPTWPFWNPVWRFTTEERRIAAEHALDVLSTAEYDIVVFAEDLSKQPQEAIPLSEEGRRQATKYRADRSLQPFHLWSRLV